MESKWLWPVNNCHLDSTGYQKVVAFNFHTWNSKQQIQKEHEEGINKGTSLKVLKLDRPVIYLSLHWTQFDNSKGTEGP